MNVVQKLSRAHLTVVPDDRRERAREKKRASILRAADALVGEEGLGAVTMQRVAERLDCAVGTLYLYFPSKAALVSALQGQALSTLRASYEHAKENAEAYVAEADLDEATSRAFDLLVFSEFWIAASIVFGDEFALQRALLSEPVGHRALDELATIRPLIDALLDEPESLLRAAYEGGALQPPAAKDAPRALVWIASLNGVLLLDGLAPIDQHQFRGHHVARLLTADLLRGWGADVDELQAASAHIERLATTVAMAPPILDDRR